MSVRAVAGWPANRFRTWPYARVEPFTEREARSRETSVVAFPAWLAAIAVALLITFTLVVLLRPDTQIRATDIPQPSGQAQTPPAPPHLRCAPAACN